MESKGVLHCNGCCHELGSGSMGNFLKYAYCEASAGGRGTFHNMSWMSGIDTGEHLPDMRRAQNLN